MTYALSICVDDGFVCAADTRTNAGVDYVTTYNKVHLYQPAPDRMFVLLTAGNLGITQEVNHWIERDLEAGDGRESLANIEHLFEAADYVGRLSRTVQERHREAFERAKMGTDSSFIVAGQIGAERHGIFLVYPQGNCVEASADTPYLQIGESKYGKPMLDRLVRTDVSLADAARLALVSLDATVRSNVTVAAPFDLLVYHAGTFAPAQHWRLTDSDPFLQEQRRIWQDGVTRAFSDLPRFPWEDTSPKEASS